MTGMTESPTYERDAAAADTPTERDRRDDEIRGALEHDQDKADGTIAGERRDARDVQERTDTQRRDARDTQDQAETEQESDRRDARDAQDLINIQAETQRRNARDAQDLINFQADTQRRNARNVQDLIDAQADTQRRDARNAQDLIDAQADTQRRDARDTQDLAETEQNSDWRDAQDLFDARREGERREAFEQTVTDHQRADEMERVIKNLDAFAYTVSHDLRAPLRAMTGCSDALLEEYGPSLGDTGRGYAEKIQAASKQMAQLIDALLHLARLARAEIHLEAVDLGAQAASIAAELQRSEPDRDTRFTIQRPVWALADRTLIRTVLQNVLQNAWKFTAGQDDADFQPSIEFGMIQGAGARIRCYVRDNGAGFDPAYADKLFTPFQRLHTTAEFPGTGVGLASAQQIVERHGGHMQAEGAVGQGATFSFTLASANPATKAIQQDGKHLPADRDAP
jgi:signal transduction histidine kinase